MKTLTHSAEVRTATGSHLPVEIGAVTAPSIRTTCIPATRAHASIAMISRTWLASDCDAMNQYPVHTFAKKHHSQRAKPT